MDVSLSPPVEGDFVETVDGLLFAVKGLFHPEGLVIAYLRYVSDAEGDRKRGGKRYRRVYDLEETTRFLSKRYPHYVHHIANLGLTLQAVPMERLAKIYKPQERLRELMANPRTDLEGVVSKFVTSLSDESGVPLEDFGVSGSILVDLASYDSDVDIIVYGEDEGHRVYMTIKTLREIKGWISPYDEKTVAGITKARWGDTGLDLNKLSRIEVKKVLHGLASGRDYFIRLVKRSQEARTESTSRPIRKVNARMSIAGAENSIFTPCTYEVNECCPPEDPSKPITELASFRGKFTEQATVGDVVEVRGTLEEVSYGTKIAYRIQMGGPGDYLIPTRMKGDNLLCRSSSNFSN
jgi:hypothetical protein